MKKHMTKTGLSRDWMIWSMVTEEIVELISSDPQRSMELLAEMVKITGQPWHVVMAAITYVNMECNSVCH